MAPTIKPRTWSKGILYTKASAGFAPDHFNGSSKIKATGSSSHRETLAVCSGMAKHNCCCGLELSSLVHFGLNYLDETEHLSQSLVLLRGELEAHFGILFLPHLGPREVLVHELDDLRAFR